MFKHLIEFIRSLYPGRDIIPLHEPIFIGNEKKYLLECVESTFVSSVGMFVDRFEEMVAHFTGAKFAIATVNGTAALHVALKLSNVCEGDEVITQPLTFVATCNAISYCGAKPVFIDVDRETLGMNPEALGRFLEINSEIRDGICYNKNTGSRISAVVPMHTFGHPCRIDKIREVCKKYKIALVEDAAESLGSFYKGKHTGTFGLFGVLSFNGNKAITTGGGGMILTNDKNLAQKAKHLTTTAKIPHAFEYVHDQIAFNYRLPNINAALGCAQMENIEIILKKKKELADCYTQFFNKSNMVFFSGPEHSQSNYWLNAVLLEEERMKDVLLTETNRSGVMTRPVWKLMSSLNIYNKCQTENIDNAIWLEKRLVNIPSSVSLP